MGEHPYAYVEGNPVNYVDPWGLEPAFNNCGSSPGRVSVMKKACNCVSGFSGSDWTAINTCIQKHAKSAKPPVVCAGTPPLDPKQQSCMKQFCGGSGTVDCVYKSQCDHCWVFAPPQCEPCYKDGTETCGTIKNCKQGEQHPTKTIYMCISNLGNKCKGGSPGSPLSPTEATFWHELSHVCGRCHDPKNTPKDACSEIYALCIGERCHTPPIKKKSTGQ